MKIIILIIISFIMTGCYSYSEIENMDIVSSIAVDYKDDYQVIIEVINNNKTKVYKSNGKSISEAFELLRLESPNKLYFSHLNTVLFTKDVDLKELTNYFLRSPKVNTTFYLLLTDNIDIYDELNGSNLKDILKNHKVYNFFHLVRRINSNIDIIIPYLNSELKIESGYLFSNNNAVKEIKYDDVEIYKLLDNINDSLFYYNGVSFLAKNVTTKFTYSNKFNINTNLNITIIENNSDYNLNDSNDLIKLEKEINDYLSDNINKFIMILKDYNSDLFGFKILLENKYHNKLHDFKDKDFNIVVSSHISKKGLLKR